MLELFKLWKYNILKENKLFDEVLDYSKKTIEHVLIPGYIDKEYKKKYIFGKNLANFFLSLDIDSFCVWRKRYAKSLLNDIDYKKLCKHYHCLLDLWSDDIIESVIEWIIELFRYNKYYNLKIKLWVDLILNVIMLWKNEYTYKLIKWINDLKIDIRDYDFISLIRWLNWLNIKVLNDSFINFNIHKFY